MLKEVVSPLITKNRRGAGRGIRLSVGMAKPASYFRLARCACPRHEWPTLPPIRLGAGFSAPFFHSIWALCDQIARIPIVCTGPHSGRVGGPLMAQLEASTG